MEPLAAPDSLSATFMKMKLNTLLLGATDAAGNWALAIPEFTGFKLFLVLKGEGWIVLKDSKSKHHLQKDDCFLVTSGEAMLATRDLSIKKPMPLQDAISSMRNGVITINGGGDCFVISVNFQFEGHLPNVLFKGLPPAIHIPADEEDAATVRWNIERFRAEFLARGAGHVLVLNHLAPIILVQILRIHMATAKEKQSWLGSLTDPKLSKSIEAIHSNPGGPWSLDSLAGLSGMSRAGFALSFKKKVGITPGEYLTHWRMQTACELLREADKSVAAVANDVGYESESAFSSAFNKVVGCRPGSYRAAQA